MKLVKPDLKYKKSFIDAVNNGFSFSSMKEISDEEKQHINNDFESFFEEKYEKQFSPVKIVCEDGNSYDRVPDTTFWLVDNNEFIGQFSLRHFLNDFLRIHSGHIGYVIRPDKRRQGYATKGLSMVLTEAKKLGLERVMVTAKEENVGSWRAIEKNGGILNDIKSMPWDPDGVKYKNYWIETR